MPLFNIQRQEKTNNEQTNHKSFVMNIRREEAILQSNDLSFLTKVKLNLIVKTEIIE